MAEDLAIIQFQRATEPVLRSLGDSLSLDDDLYGAVILAITTVRNGAWDLRQLGTIHEIEGRRAALCADGTVIEFVDYRHVRGQPERGIRQRTTLCEIAMRSKPAPWAQLIYQIVWDLKPQVSLELGTGVGLTAAYIAAALSPNEDFTTLEGDTNIAEIADETMSLYADKAVVIPGPFSVTLPKILAEDVFDFVFIDAGQDGETALYYWQQVRSRLSNWSFVILGDVDRSSDMREAWMKISNDPLIKWSINLGILGIVRPSHGIARKEIRMPSFAEWAASSPRR